MITTVTLNPAMDKTIIVEDFKVNHVNRVREIKEDVGGKGINVSKVVHFLGGDTLATGIIGGENGEKIKQFLNEMGIKEDFVEANINTRTNIKIADFLNNTTTDLNQKGEYIDKVYIEDLKNKIEYYAKISDYIVFSGSVPKGFNLDEYKKMIEISNRYAKTIVDADGDLLIQGLKAKPFMIKPNIHELEEIFGIKMDTEKEIIDGASKIIKQYGISIVLVSRGEKGSLLVTKEETYVALPIKVEVKSTVGAGDSMLGAFIYSFNKNKDLVEAFKYGSASGAAAVTTEGTKLYSKELFNKYLEQSIVKRYI